MAQTVLSPIAKIIMRNKFEISIDFLAYREKKSRITTFFACKQKSDKSDEMAFVLVFGY